MDIFQRVFWVWRIFATALAYGVFILGGMTIPLLFFPTLFLLPGGKDRRQQRARRIVHWLFLAFVHFMRMLGLLKWRLEGLYKLQRPGVLILANHPTLLDVVFLIAFVPNATCIVKSRLRKNPAMSGFIAMTGYIYNDNGTQLIDAAHAALNSSAVLIIFPEGTRTCPSQPFYLHRGAANIAVRCAKDITPVIVGCTPRTLSKQHKWYHIPDRPFLMSFRVKDDISIAPYTGNSSTTKSRQLTKYLENYFTKETRLNV